MLNIEIDGKALEVENGSSIIDAADKVGISIPRFCYHPKLSVAANCRMCLVQVENFNKPLPACATPVADGMKIFTRSKSAIEAQKSVMEFLLINHPLDCPVGMNPVVVHGGGPQIETALKRLGKKGEFIQGMRVTDDETMEVVEWVLAGEVQQDIVGLINQAGGKAVGLTGRDGGLIRAKKLKMFDPQDPNKEYDLGQVGDIESIDPSVVKALQDDAFIPVISPIGFGEHNESYNINADVVAGKLASVLKAEKLVLLTNTPGVLDKAGNLLTDLSARRIDELFADGTISGGMLPKISSALDAAKSGVNAVHIIDGRVPHAMLLEILTDQAFGTMIRSH